MSDTETNWNLEQYNQICQRDRTDGGIFWNKVSVLIAVNFGLVGLLSLKLNGNDGTNPSLFLCISALGFVFSFIWLSVLKRQAKWVKYWKDQLAEMEKEGKVMLYVQTDGEDFENKKMGLFLKAGSYRHVASWFPAVFALIWGVVLLASILYLNPSFLTPFCHQNR